MTWRLTAGIGVAQMARMVKLIFLCQRRPDITHERYVDLLLGGHVPIALQHHPMLRRYVVNIVDHKRVGADDFDSVGELSFDSLADYRDRLYDSPGGQAVVQRDVAGFIGSVMAYATEAHVRKATPRHAPLGTRSPGVKLICPIQRLPGMTHAEFAAHWFQRHGPLALAHHSRMIGYVHNLVEQRLSPTGEDWDGIAEMHFAAEADLQNMFDSPEGERLVREDMARFIGKVAAYRVAEYVQKLA
jgi:uncharacterized protein (TIGR02118 family)